MLRIFAYETRRLLGGRTFIGALAVSLFYAWQTLCSKTILGVAHTAPFSPWSFGAYLSVLMPLLCAVSYLLLWDVFSPAAQRLRPLTDATGADISRYYLVRFAAVGFCVLLMALLLAGAGLIFLHSLFPKEALLSSSILPFLLCVLPSLLFPLGAGALAGSYRPALLFLTLPLILALSFAPLPMATELFLNGFFESYPLDFIDPPFSFPILLLACRAVYTLLGALMLYAASKKSASLQSAGHRGSSVIP